MRGTSGSSVRVCTALVFSVVLAVATTSAVADNGHTIQSGAISIGASGAFSSIEGSTSGSIGIRSAYFQSARGLTLGYNAGWGYTHVSDLDLVDITVGAAAMRRIGNSSAHPFVALGAGLRQEWIGSFSQARYPVGFDVGMIALVSASAAFNVAYEFRRVLDDPVSDFTEHRIVLGLSVFFRNQWVRSE